jgi:LacI family transcriptional regulator
MYAQARVTIKDVAAAAGVSHQTVSRVINDRPDVAEGTRRRVWQIIEDLNYQPSAIARSLTHQRTFTLGVVTAGLDFIGPSRTLNGITKQAEEMGFTLLLKELSSFDTNDVYPILKSLFARQVDGIIWAVPKVGNNRQWLKDQPPGLAVPMIFLTMPARPDLHVVSVDNYKGGRMATNHLIEQGYRHIGHISGPLDWWEARQRKAGWQDALLAAGLDAADHRWEPGNWSSTSGERAISRLLDRDPALDAVFVGNDQMALGVLQTACQQGLHVPGDLAIVGFDGVPETAYYWPPLTTVQQDQQQLGCLAVRELVRSIQAWQQGQVDGGPKTISLDPDLIVRASSIASKV